MRGKAGTLRSPFFLENSATVDNSRFLRNAIMPDGMIFSWETADNDLIDVSCGRDRGFPKSETIRYLRDSRFRRNRRLLASSSTIT